MKQTKILKRTVGLLVSAVMLICTLSISVMATDSVPTSDVYTFEGNTVYVLKNTYVGDFLRRIDSHDSVKKVVDAGGTQVNHGFVTEDMKLKIGDTQYDIAYVVLYDMQERIADIPDNTQVFSYSYGVDGSNYNSAVSSSSAMTEIFATGLSGTVNQADAYINVYKKSDENGPYLEFTTNSQRTLNFVTESLGNYANEATYGEYVVSELDVKGISYSGTANAASTGYLTMGHYYKGDFGGVSDAKISDDVFDKTNTTEVSSGSSKALTNTDFVSFSNNNGFAMGGSGYENYAAASTDIVLVNKTGYTTGTEYNVKQFIKIPEPEDSEINISGLYLDNVLQSGYAKYTAYNGKTSFDIPLKDSVTNIKGVAKGTVGIGRPRSTKSAFEGVTTVQIYNYSIYLADNLISEQQGNLYINGAKNVTDEYGHASSYGSKTLTNVMPGTTVKELTDIIQFGDHAFVQIKRGNTELTDNSIIAGGDTLSIYNLSDAGALASRTYTISLATIGQATTLASGTDITVSRQCSNLGLGTFMFAAYDVNDMLIAVMTAEGADSSGVRSVTFDNSGNNIAYVKSFVFKNMASLMPLTNSIAAVSAE